MADSLTKQATSNAGFIRAYGLFWEASEVDWTGQDSLGDLTLLGRRKERKPALRVVNFWEQRGIYVLYNDYGPYYVGKTHGVTMSLGERLKDHALGRNGSPHKGKWTRFSWFGWRGVLEAQDELGLQKLREMPTKLLTDSENTVGDIEALLIYALGTRHVGNARNETFKAAAEWNQIWHHEQSTFLDRIAR